MTIIKHLNLVEINQQSGMRWNESVFATILVPALADAARASSLGRNTCPTPEWVSSRSGKPCSLNHFLKSPQGMEVITPAPSPESLSAPHPPRCSIHPKDVRASLTILWDASFLRLAMYPTPHASRSAIMSSRFATYPHTQFNHIIAKFNHRIQPKESTTHSRKWHHTSSLKSAMARVQFPKLERRLPTSSRIANDASIDGPKTLNCGRQAVTKKLWSENAILNTKYIQILSYRESFRHARES